MAQSFLANRRGSAMGLRTLRHCRKTTKAKLGVSVITYELAYFEPDNPRSEGYIPTCSQKRASTRSESKCSTAIPRDAAA
jgi:hypothetical protein